MAAPTAATLAMRDIVSLELIREDNLQRENGNGTP